MASRRDTSSDRKRTRNPAGGRGSAGAEPKKSRTHDESAGMQDDAAGPQGEAAQTQLLQSLQQILLAGMTAFTRAQKTGPAAFQEAFIESLRMLGRSGSAAQSIFRDAFGTAQDTLQSRMGNAREQAQETMDNIEALFQSRVQRTLHQLGVPTAEEIRVLTKRVAELNTSVSQMNAQPRTRKKAARSVAASKRRVHTKTTQTRGAPARRAQARRRATPADGGGPGDEVT